jgi:putative flippase GtrA
MTLVSYGLLVGSAGLGLHYMVGVTLGWIVPAAIAFVLHGRFTFPMAGSRPDPRRFALFMGQSVLQWAVVSLGYVAAVELFGLGLTAAFVVNTGLGACLSFAMMRMVVFRAR